MEKVRLLLSAKVRTQFYVDAVSSLGAVATAEYLPKVSTDFDGLILCGGSDIHPKHFGEQINGSVNIDEERDEAEFALLEAYVKAGKPVLGICRGHQLMNVYFGGSLIQHIPEADEHKRAGDTDRVHQVSATESSVLHRLYGPCFSVNSAHHQALDRLGDGLVATAYWNGRYVEAFEHRKLPIFGVQWHPERMCLTQKRKDTVDGIEIFKYFVDICKGRTNGKNG